MTATVIGISTEGRAGSITKDGHRHHTVIYKVRTDNRLDGDYTVLRAFGIPNVGDVYQPGNDLDVASVVLDKHATQAGSPWFWEVEVQYSTDLGDKDPRNLSKGDNPLNEPPEAWFTWQERRVPITGYHNDPKAPPDSRAWFYGLYLPNGDLFNPQPEADLAEPIWNVKRNVASINEAALMSLANCVNADEFKECRPRQLRFKPPLAPRKWHKTIGYYFEVQYQLEFRWETWDIQQRNDSTYYWVGGKPASVWTTTISPMVLFDVGGNPRIINLSTNGDVNTTANPTFTRIRYYREVNFSSLGIL